MSAPSRDTPAGPTAIILIGAALIIALAPMVSPAVATAAPEGAATVTSQERPHRPFDHARHEALSCLECHGSGAAHRTIRVRTPRDCATCHHDSRRALRCATCHDSAGPRTEVVVRAGMLLSPSAAATSRQLPFLHERHVGGGRLACVECHTEEVTLARTRTCASCHAAHHTAESRCAACHREPRSGAHTVSVHLGCAGSSCHQSDRAPSPVLSRELCLACHPSRREHEPGGACASCHLIPGAPRVAPDNGQPAVRR